MFHSHGTALAIICLSMFVAALVRASSKRSQNEDDPQLQKEKEESGRRTSVTTSDRTEKDYHFKWRFSSAGLHLCVSEWVNAS